MAHRTPLRMCRSQSSDSIHQARQRERERERGEGEERRSKQRLRGERERCKTTGNKGEASEEDKAPLPTRLTDPATSTLVHPLSAGLTSRYRAGPNNGRPRHVGGDRWTGRRDAWAAALARIGPMHVSLNADEPITSLQMDISHAI
ncbi:unnamed protein product [Pleuronectes platessa]|uniref:Uncharacterized protein n=1 Tax=Pleuronectes platessa TaxID=8262 RepID=A0A9N7V0J7_PLEPL|nr:unnamed protein product [Pleuronectes platessa]